jgi:hypothetical protein
MGYPISSTVTEIYLQYLEETHLKQAIENKRVLYYKSYVDDLLTVYDDARTIANSILEIANKIDHNLSFKGEVDEKATINYLDLSLHREDKRLASASTGNPHTYMDITIHFISNHSHLQKLAAFHYFIQRLSCLPLLHKAKEQE